MVTHFFVFFLYFANFIIMRWYFVCLPPYSSYSTTKRFLKKCQIFEGSYVLHYPTTHTKVRFPHKKIKIFIHKYIFLKGPMLGLSDRGPIISLRHLQPEIYGLNLELKFRTIFHNKWKIRIILKIEFLLKKSLYRGKQTKCEFFFSKIRNYDSLRTKWAIKHYNWIKTHWDISKNQTRSLLNATLYQKYQ